MAGGVSGLGPDELHGVVTLRDAALSTSRAPAGRRRPGRSSIRATACAGAGTARIATVRAADATTAEAWSKAVIVLGRDGMHAPAPTASTCCSKTRDGVARTRRLRAASRSTAE